MLFFRKHFFQGNKELAIYSCCFSRHSGYESNLDRFSSTAIFFSSPKTFCIRETLKLLTVADSRTDTILRGYVIFIYFFWGRSKKKMGGGIQQKKLLIFFC